MKKCWEYAEEYLSYRESLGFSAENNPKYYALDLSRFLQDRFPDAENITFEMIELWLLRRSTESSESFRTRISCTRTFLKFLIGRGVTTYQIPDEYTPKKKRPFVYICTDDELRRFFEQCDSENSIKTKDRCRKILYPVFYRVIYYCGLRPGEGRCLRVDDVDLVNMTLRIRENKAHKERIIPIAEDLADFLAEYIKKLHSILPESTFLFPTEKGDVNPARWIRQEFRRLWKAANPNNHPEDMYIYNLRHRWATITFTRLMDEKMDLNAIIPYISSYMGHDNFDDTAYYIHLLPERLKQATSINWGELNDMIPEVEFNEI